MITSKVSCSKKKLHISLNSKKLIQNRLNKLNPDNELKLNELYYDNNIDAEFKNNHMVNTKKANLELIAELPILELQTIVQEEEEEEEENKVVDNKFNDDNEEDDIDKDSLEKDTIGDNVYYFDYSKGIIYNINYKIIGNIDEYGELNIVE